MSTNITVQLSDEMKRAVRVAAAKRDMSISEFTRDALKLFIEIYDNGPSVICEQKAEYDVK